MFKPTNYSPSDPWKNNYREVIKSTLLVMNFLHFTTNEMKKFKSGVKFSAIIGNAHYCIDSDTTRSALDYINKGKHNRWELAKIHIDSSTDGRVRCYLKEKNNGSGEYYTHYLTVRDNKVKLIRIAP